jgi:hypothetical protein
MSEADHIIVDSCHSVWIFDTERLRFRRVLKGLGRGDEAAMTEWRRYHRLELDQDSDSVVVVLNDSGTRLLHSWRHTGSECAQCGDAGTEELALDDIARAEGS